jgi:hypothetical protein
MSDEQQGEHFDQASSGVGDDEGAYELASSCRSWRSRRWSRPTRLVLAHGAALSGWHEVGRDLGATLNADVAHWPAHQPATSTLRVLISSARHDGGSEGFDAAQTLTRVG